MASPGGARPGAGRKKGSVSSHNLEAVKTRQEFIKKVEENLVTIFEALLNKAKQGDVGAIRELLDRAWGKAQQSVDLTNKGEKFEIGTIIITPPNEDRYKNKSNTETV